MRCSKFSSLFWIFLPPPGQIQNISISKESNYHSSCKGFFSKVQMADLTCDVTSIRLQCFDPWPISDEYSNFARACAGHVTRFFFYKIMTLLWYLRLTCFCSFFGRNWRHQKDNSILTDLSNFRRVNNKCTVPPLTKLFDNLFFFKFQYGIIRLIACPSALSI